MATTLEKMSVTDVNGKKTDFQALSLDYSSPSAVSVANAVKTIVEKAVANLDAAAKAFAAKGGKLDTALEKAILYRRAERAVGAFISEAAATQTFATLNHIEMGKRGRTASEEAALDGVSI